MTPRSIVFVFSLLAASSHAIAQSTRPNVVVIITDDQGVGDFGFMGNPLIRTPHLDAMAVRSARLTNFYVQPVCSPTRACLMTGRYNYRTGVIDTAIGRSMMRPKEVTVAEILQGAGYATGLFGKWHLGDCHPMRPQDQGFEEVLMHRGGGIGQPSDPPGAEGKYTDPVLIENGERVEKQGYCTDLYFDAAREWISECHGSERPFFAYIATNAPHGPFHDVPADWLERYQREDLSNEGFPETEGHPVTGDANLDRRARIFAMISNIDDNVGRLFATLSELEILEDTLVLFLNDNGPNGPRYSGGYRGQKSDVYEGGIRSVLFAHWTGTLRAGHTSDRIAAHIDLLPTILAACSVEVPARLELDGRDVLPLLKGDVDEWPDRPLVIQSHRGDRPERYHHVAIRTQRWKLLHPSGFGRESFEGEPRFELYDVASDPYEMHDVAAKNGQVVARLRSAYEAWFDDVTGGSDFQPPRILIGSPHENPVHLTRQDWRHESGRGWAKGSRGSWHVEVVGDGPYDIEVRRHPQDQREGVARLGWNDDAFEKPVASDESVVTFPKVALPKGPLNLEASVTSGDETWGAYQVVVGWSGE